MAEEVESVFLSQYLFHLFQARSRSRPLKEQCTVCSCHAFVDCRIDSCLYRDREVNKITITSLKFI